MDIFLERSLPTLEGMDLSLTNRLASLAARVAPKWLVETLSRLSVNKMLAHKKHFCCPLTTVSAIIETEVVEPEPFFPDIVLMCMACKQLKPERTFQQ